MSKKLKAGSVLIRINNKYYEVPDIDLFKTKNNKDVYLSGITQKVINNFKSEWIARIKLIESDEIIEVDFNIIEKYLKITHRKFIVDNKEYDIPSYLFNEIKEIYSKIHHRDIKSLNELKLMVKEYLFKPS